MDRSNVVVAAIVGGIFAVIAAFGAAMIARDSREGAAEGTPLVDRQTLPAPSPTDVILTESSSSKTDSTAAADLQNQFSSHATATPPSRQAQAITAADDHQPYQLDRTDIFFRFPTAESTIQPEMWIGFRNASPEILQFRVKLVYLVIDGVPIQTVSQSQWESISPAQGLGPQIRIENRGIMLRVGSIIDVTYEIEIRKFQDSTVENRYERVRKTVISFSPLRMSEQQVATRTTILPSSH